MKKNFFRILSVFLAAVMVFSSIPVSFAAETEDESTTPLIPLNVEINTNKNIYSAINTVSISVTLTNISEETVENISAEAVFDKLMPIGKDSKISLEKDSLPAGESVTFNYKAIANSDEIRLNFFQNLILRLVKLFKGTVIVSDNGFDDGRYFIDETKNITIGGTETTEIVRVWYGEEISQEDKVILSNGGAPYVAMDEDDDIPSFIIGKFTQRTVIDENDVYSAISDISDILNISNVHEELKLYQIDEFDSISFYKFKQVFEGIEVYSKNLNLSIDEAGYVNTISCDYDPIDEIDLTVNYNSNYASEHIKSYLEENESIISIDKVILPQSNHEHLLVWKITTTNGTFFVSCKTGDVVLSTTNLLYEAATGTGNYNGETVSFNSLKADNTYYLSDYQRNIVSVNAKGSTLQKWPCIIDSNNVIYYYDFDDSKWYKNNSSQEVQIDDSAGDNHIIIKNMSGSIIGRNGYRDLCFQTVNIFDSPEVPYSSSSNYWTNEKAVKSYYNTILTYDYYWEHFGRKGFNGQNGTMYVAFDDNNGFDTTNAYSSTIWSDSYNTLLSFGKDNHINIDTVAHEFTHSVEQSISSMEYQALSGALMEAYSDIMGEIVEASVNNGTINWIHGNRNMINPLANNYPNKYLGDKWANTAGSDHGGVHTNCTVISHAAYLMNTTGISDVNELGELWYRSLFYLQSNASFYDCRAAVVASARDMGLNDNKLTCISNAFDSVNVDLQHSPLFGLGNSKIIGKVISADTGTAIAGAFVRANGTGMFNSGATTADLDGNFTLSGLRSGLYTISVEAAGYIENEIQVNIPSNNETIYLEQSIMLNSEYQNQNGLISGVVRNALDNNYVVGAMIRFRNGHGNETGEYVETNGYPIEIYTSSNGSYSCENLITGYYTAEVSCENYITAYFNVIVSPSNEICRNQNFAITPILPEGQYRIVLTWGQNPADLDSHITGPRMDGSEFHVYYSSKNAYDGDVHVANLDVDDVTSYGPETVTLNPTTNGTYRYFIYHYSGSGSISTSGAQIKLYNGNTLIGTYNAPVDQGTGRYWTVFEITNGEVRNVNRIGDSVYTNSSLNGASEQTITLDNLPPKENY